MTRLIAVLLPWAALLFLVVPAASASTIEATASQTVVPGPKPGVKRILYKFGPVTIAPGQNTIEFEGNELKPDVPGHILRFKPDLTYVDGEVPRVDDIHLHHAVWVSNFRPLFAAGEEKTIFNAPDGYGLVYKPQDNWIMNHMIHNLTPTPTKVFITYEIDFTEAGTPADAGVKHLHTLWSDVEAGKIYPVFDVHKGQGGRDRRYTYPQESPTAMRARRDQLTIDQDGVLVGTAGHLHPGGLWTDLKLTRGGRTVNLFRSKAHYWEPAGAVSWDVAMTATTPKWRVKVRRGDVLSVSATYDSKRASWYESMGIDPVAFAPGAGGGVDPFSGKLDKRGKITHGHLRENRNHGGGSSGLPDPRKLAAGPVATAPLAITDFLYGQGDLLSGGARSRPATVAPGGSLTFVNNDAARTIFHTITACRAPCNRTTGIAYPLADGPVDFDSGELGFGPQNFTAAANRDTWSTPATLSAGTYTYFCRIHPFMRGSFRVSGS